MVYRILSQQIMSLTATDPTNPDNRVLQTSYLSNQYTNVMFNTFDAKL